MKILKKLFSVVCAVTILSSILIGATVVDAAHSTGVSVKDTAYITIDLENDSFDENKNLTILFKTPLTSVKGHQLTVIIPDGLKGYIANTEWQTPFNDVEMLPSVTNNYYVCAYTLGTSHTSGLAPVNGVFAKLKLTFTSDVPEDVDRTIKIAGSMASPFAQYTCSVTDGDSNTSYFSVEKGTDCKVRNVNIWEFVSTEEGNYVVVPAAKAEEPDNTVAFEGFTGTKENGEADGSVAVATSKTFTTKADAPSQINWTVNLKAGGKGTYTSTVDATGGAEFTLGMVINGLAKELVASIEAVLVQ